MALFFRTKKALMDMGVSWGSHSFFSTKVSLGIYGLELGFPFFFTSRDEVTRI